MSGESFGHEVVERVGHSRYRYPIFVAGVIGVAALLVSISLSLYKSSGTAQLDLSRPAFQNVRKEAKADRNIAEFPATGVLNDTAMADFKKLYDARSKKATDVNSFSDAALSEDSLQLMNPSTVQPDTTP